MSKSILRALLGRTLPDPVGNRLSERYRKGLLTSYLSSARDTLAAAEPLAAASKPDLALVKRQLARSAVALCKAVRISHELSATRDVAIRNLVHGDGSTPGLPDESPWRVALAPLVALDVPGAVDEPLVWIATLRQLLDRAQALPRPSQTPRARARRATTDGRR